MDLTSGTIITLKNNKYIILEKLIYNNSNYIFTNEVRGTEDLTENYYIFKILTNEALLITDKKLINILLPKFQEKLSKTINNIL